MYLKNLKRLICFCIVSVILTSTVCFAQEKQYDDEGFEIFSYQDKDTVYVMKKYFMAFLKSGTKISDPEEATAVQQAHLNHMSMLAEKNKICIAGPFGDDTEFRGVVIYNVKDEIEARSYIESDPAVVAGVLAFEIHPWWAAKGSRLP